MLPRRPKDTFIRDAALFVSLVTLWLTLVALAHYYKVRSVRPDVAYVLTAHMPWIIGGGQEAAEIDIAYRVGVDGISIHLLAMTALLSPLAIWSSFSAIRTRVREYYILLLLLQVGLLGVFCAQDLLLFYVFFEFTLIPLFFLIGIWGGSHRRHAANKFFIYTIAGSVFTFAGVVYFAYFAYTSTGELTLNMKTLTSLGQNGRIPFDVQWWLFLAFA